MQVSALSYAERLPEWTPTITTDTDAAGGYDIYTYQDLELAYPGHWGKGFWIVTGDYRVTDRANLGYASFFLYNSATQLAHGVCGGYVYDTNWKQFSIIAGWQSDFPSTMKLHLELAVSTGAASNIVRVRNVRLAFIQLADRDGIPLVGRDANSAGYHVQTMKWDYSPFDAVELEPLDPFGSTNHVANLAVMTNSGMASAKTYMTMHHINGVNCYGYEAHTNADKMDVVLDAGNEYAARMRPLPGYYPSYGFITHKTSFSTTNGVRQPYNSFIQATNASFEQQNLSEPPYVQFNPVANVSIDYYGGWFMMTLEKDASDEVVFTGNTSLGSGSANTSANLVSNTAGAASLQRSLYFGVGHTSSYGTNRADLSVTIDGKVIHSANVTDLGSANGGFATPYSHFTFANEVVDGNKRTLRETITRNGSGGSIGYGPRQGLLIPVSRAYVNSTYKIANTAANQGTGSQTWANVANLYTANTSAYAQMANVSPTAANNRYLRVTNFKFNEHIPADATIGYVWMSPVCRRAGAAGDITWDDVKMVANGAAVGTSVAWTSPWANTWSYVGPNINLGASTYWTLDNTVAEGGSVTRDGLWNYRPTAAQVRASNFGFQMRCKSAANTSPTAQISHVTAVVYFRVPGEKFTRSVTCNAGVVDVVTPKMDKDMTRRHSLVKSPVVKLPKRITQTPKNLSLDNVVSHIRFPMKSLRRSVHGAVSFGRAMTKGIGITESPAATLPKKAIKRPVALSFGNTVDAFKQAIKRKLFTPGNILIWHKDMTKAGMSVAAPSNASEHKMPRKKLVDDMGHNATSSKSPRKRLRVVSTPIRRIRKLARRFFDVAATHQVSDAIRKFTKYVVNLTVQSPVVPTMRKLSRRSIGAASVASAAVLNVFNVFILNLSRVSVPSVVSSGRDVGKALRYVSGIVSKYRKDVSITRDTETETLSGVAKVTAKASDHAQAITATLVKQVRRFARFARSPLARLRKKTSIHVEAGSSVVARLRKIMRKKLAVIEDGLVSIKKRVATRKSIVRPVIGRVRKVASRHIETVQTSTARSRRRVVKLALASSNAVVRVRKRIARKVSAVALGIARSASDVVAKTKILLLSFVEKFSFFEIANGVLRARETTFDGEAEYINFTKHRIASEPEEAEYRVPDVESVTVTVSHTDEQVIRL